MNVKLISKTVPSEEIIKEGIEDLQDLVAFCARVSNPSNQYNAETADRLVQYLIKHKHWSPFEMVNVCLEIETTRDIARQFLRHRSFSFQEFCVAGDTLIHFDLPRSKKERRQIYKQRIDVLYNRQKKGLKIPRNIRVYDENSRSIVNTKLVEVFQTGVKPVYQVSLSNGKKIKCTKEHKFLSREGFDTLENISKLRHVANTITFDKTVHVATNGVECWKDKEWLEYERTVTIEWSTIQNIEFIGEEMTYDLEVNHPSHNYVANGIIVHNSQRYAHGTDLGFELREARLQDQKNRQNSIDVNDSKLQLQWELQQRTVIDAAKAAYDWAISQGIAKEVARAVLPEGLTKSRMYVNGTLRSWIHYIEVRADNTTQKEHRHVAIACAKVIAELFPAINKIPTISTDHQ